MYCYVLSLVSERSLKAVESKIAGKPFHSLYSYKTACSIDSVKY